MPRYTHYLALGDSMSTDEYPSCDLLGVSAVPAALLPVGASSLLYRNRDDLWPDFRGRDLASGDPAAKLAMLARDGARILDVRDALRWAPEMESLAVLVTLTAGGNDLLGALGATASLSAAVEGIVQRYSDLVRRLRKELPRSTLVVTTVYDPSDGTGQLPGLSDFYGRLPLEHLGTFNEHVRRIAEHTPGSCLADVHRHFLGHGITAPEPARWYWSRSMIEPNARGASEIRRVWLEAVESITRQTPGGR